MNQMDKSEDFIRDLISNTFDDTGEFFLENLHDKCSEIYYIDSVCDGCGEPKIFKKISDNLTEAVLEYHFSEDDPETLHPFIYCDPQYVETLGFSSLIICPYKGMFANPYLQSNYMATWINGKCDLIIDIYNTINLKKKDINRLIMIELLNFKRDLEWVKEGTYDSNIEAMKNVFNAFSNIVGFA